MLIRFIIICFILLFVEFYAFQAFKTLLKVKWTLVLYQVFSILIFVYIVYSLSKFDRSLGQTRDNMNTMGLLLLVFVPKILLTFVMFGEDIFRLCAGAINYFVEYDNRDHFLADRRKFVSQIGMGLAAVPFLSLLYGMTIGKYNFRVIKQRLYFEDLPTAFDGFKITQISDIHSGSFDNSEKINYAIDLINQQKSDMILFTGDIVNSKASEMLPWIDSFNRIEKHKFGHFSVLGNHDYGEYLQWDSAEAKSENFQQIKDLHHKIGFDLMLNQHQFVHKDNEKIAIVGVENWGHNFKKAGDINKASIDLKKEDFKILMSHDPSHWEKEVKHHDKFFQLTLSGHTHGMQFGIEIPGIIKWSLAQYMYKQWAGLYEHKGRYIYVNRGFGFHAYPGRVGIMPEITVIELKKGKSVV